MKNEQSVCENYYDNKYGTPDWFCLLFLTSAQYSLKFNWSQCLLLFVPISAFHSGWLGYINWTIRNCLFWIKIQSFQTNINKKKGDNSSIHINRTKQIRTILSFNRIRLKPKNVSVLKNNFILHISFLFVYVPYPFSTWVIVALHLGFGALNSVCLSYIFFYPFTKARWVSCSVSLVVNITCEISNFQSRFFSLCVLEISMVSFWF